MMMMMMIKNDIDTIMGQIFDPKLYRSPRSEEYKAGVKAIIAYYLDGKKTSPTCSYPEGTAQRDAWFSGVDEGHFQAKKFNLAQKEGEK